MIEQLLDPFPFEFFRNGLDRGDDRRRAVRAHRRLRRAAGHELHRPRPLPRHLRRLRRQRGARHQLLPRRRRVGRRLGAPDRRRHARAADRRRRRHRRGHHGLLRARSRPHRPLRRSGRSFDAALFGSILGVARRTCWSWRPSASAPSPSSSCATGRCCSRRSTPRSRRVGASTWPGRSAADAHAHGLDPGLDERDRRHPRRGRDRHPGGRRPPAHRLLHPMLVLATAIGGACGASA